MRPRDVPRPQRALRGRRGGDDDARRDALTLLGNRLRLTEDLASAAAHVERYGHSYCLAMYASEYFNRYNDEHGHPAAHEAVRTRGQAPAEAGPAAHTRDRTAGGGEGRENEGHED